MCVCADMWRSKGVSRSQFLPSYFIGRGSVVFLLLRAYSKAADLQAAGQFSYLCLPSLPAYWRSAVITEVCYWTQGVLHAPCAWYTYILVGKILIHINLKKNKVARVEDIQSWPLVSTDVHTGIHIYLTYTHMNICYT